MTARVLHVLDQPGETPEALALRLSADVSRLEHRDDETHAWLLLGGESMRSAALASGIDPACIRLMPRPQGVGRLMPAAQRGMKALLRSADRVACWTVGASEAVARVGCGYAVPRFGQATLCPYSKQIIERAVRNARDSRGNRGEAGDRSGSDTRASIRQRWGINDDTMVVALLADHPGDVNAREAWLSAAFTFETLAAARAKRWDIRLLCHPLAHRRAEADNLADLLFQPQLVMQDACMLTPWQVLPGCDIALAPRPRHAGLSILWAHAMGVPVFAAPDPGIEMLAELEGVKLSMSDHAKHLAHPLTEWAFAQQPTLRAVGT